MENSIKLPVDFVDVEDHYYNDRDLYCYYKINNYLPQQGDRIAIFKMGWKSLKDYILFDWVKDFDKTIARERTTPSCVIFKSVDLPKDIDDDYQFCYINNQNIIHGVSKPFQILTQTSNNNNNNNKITVLMQLLNDKDNEIMKLREENAILKESLRAIIEQRHQHHQPQQQQQNYDNDIKQLKEITNKLMNSVKIQQNEIDTLKIKLYTGRHEWKNMLKEKEIVEKKFQILYENYDNFNNIDDGKRILKDIDFNLDDLQSMPPFPL